MRHDFDELELALADAESSTDVKAARVIALRQRLGLTQKQFQDYEASARAKLATAMQQELQKNHDDWTAALEACDKRMRDAGHMNDSTPPK